jgi:hypothetical protein
MIKVQSVDNMIDRSGVKCVVFGKPKTGKTTLIKTAPSPIIFSSERGLLSLKGSGLSGITIETMKDLDDAFAWLSSTEAQKYRTIAWDSVSDTAEAILAGERKSGTHKKNDHWAPYNALADKMTEKLRDARNMAGRNWYLICQEEIIQTAEGTRIAVPSLPGKALLQNLPYLFDLIAQMVLYVDPVTGEESRALKTRGDNVTMGGDRSGKLDQWEPPDLAHVFGKMLG